MSAIELPVTFESGALHHDLLNQQFAAVKSSLNELLSYITALQDSVQPADLGGYATTVQLNEHVADSVPHSGIAKWGSGTALAGSDFVAGSALRIETVQVTLTAGAGTATFGTAFDNGLLSVQCTVLGASANAVAFQNPTLSDVDLVGTGTDVVFVTAIGW